MKHKRTLATLITAAVITIPFGQQAAVGAPVAPAQSGVAIPPGLAPTPSAPADPAWIPGSEAMVHLQKFQDIADANGGNRAEGTSGFRATTDYVATTMRDAGFTVTTQRVGNGSVNIIADRPGRDTSKVIAAGAHLDSVQSGPGINDDASGMAALLTAAQNMKKNGTQTDKSVRFLFFGAEEVGIVGSRAYASDLSRDEAAAIEAYVNFDMVGRANPPQWGVYQEGPEINAHLRQFFDRNNVRYRMIDASGRGDHASLADVGIPVTGIDSNGDMNNLEPCYHRACDDLSNVSASSMEISTNALMDVIDKTAGATP